MKLRLTLCFALLLPGISFAASPDAEASSSLRLVSRTLSPNAPGFGHALYVQRTGLSLRSGDRVSTNNGRAWKSKPMLPDFASGLPHGYRREIEEEFRAASIPAANGMFTARSLARLYACLAHGGELDGVRVLEPRTVRRAVAEQSYLEFDLSLAMPVRYGMGFMLGGQWLSFYGPDTVNAFGHIGFINVMGWADPDRQISVGFTNSGKPLLYPEIAAFSDIFKQIGLACPKEPGYDWLATLSRPRARQSIRSKTAVPPPEATIH